jgi:23S rRNA pseudouridine2605 synthase
MPPRYAYWTILIDNAPTAFRAHDREELLPTLTQLRRTNPNAEMKWFAQGKLWASPEEAHEARRARPPLEPRGAGWRPGGRHEDPRDRFRKKSRERRDREHAIDERGARGDRAEGSGPPRGGGFRPRENRPEREGQRPPFRPKGPGGARKAWSRPPAGGERTPFKPKGPGGARKPWGRPPAHRAGGFRPGEERPAREGERPPSKRPGEFRARDNRGGQQRPWPREDRPPRNSGGGRPFKPKGPRGPRGPRGNK